MARMRGDESEESTGTVKGGDGEMESGSSSSFLITQFVSS